MRETDRITMPWAAAADTLAASLRDTPEYAALDAAGRRLNADPQAQRVIREWQRAQHAARMFGGLLGGSERLQRAERNLRGNATVQDYLAGQEALQTLLREVAGVVSERVGFDFALACAPPGGCCG